MINGISTTRQPWRDRWARPTIDHLLQPLKQQHRKPFRRLLDELNQFDGVAQNLVWYGESWKWTIHYGLAQTAPNGDDEATLCYLVPNQEAPMVCVPLSEPLIDKLPLRRLSKFVREGIRNAKCAVSTHWATWPVNNDSEAGLLLDLLERKRRLLVPAPAGSGSAPGNGNGAKTAGGAARERN